MSSVEVRALLRAAWQESFNRSWRFSPAKSGLWFLAVQAGIAVVVIWRMTGAEPVAEPAGLILLGGLQAALFAFLVLFLQGRSRLFEGPVVRLIHLSPTPAQAAITAIVLGSVPQRAWSALLITVALWPAIPMSERLWAAPALWLAVLTGGLIGQLAGVVALILWVRLLPQALGAIWLLSMITTLAMVYYVGYLLIAGVPVADLVALVEGAGRRVPVGLLTLFGLPAGFMLLRLLRAPGRAGEAYREGWLGLMERGDMSSRPRRSRFPRPVAGPVGAVAALTWLMSLRNWMSLLRIGLWLAALGGILLAGPALRGLGPERRPLFILGLSLALALLNYGEQAAALFAADGPRFALFALAGLRPLQFLLGKWLAALPLVLVAGATAVVTALVAGASVAAAGGFGVTAGVIAIGSLSILIGAAAFDVSLMEGGTMAGDEPMRDAIEQAPTRPGGIVGLIGSVAFAAAAVWLFDTRQGLLGLLLIAPVVAVVAGLIRLRSEWAPR